MSYLALYRRYRPDSFENLIGQEHIVKTLVNQIENDRLGHAYLFTGTRGTGKTSCAKIFAKAINCEHPVNGSPCEKCASCKALSDTSNIDVIEIDAASNNGVNEIRDLIENVQYPPVSCRYKVYIIDEVHMLTGAAFNALLKTLEEPPKHAVFILATTEAHKIPQTILSRCMRFDFKLIPTEKIATLISKIFDEQGKKYEKEAVFAIAKAGEGSIRDALSIADIAISHNEGTLTYDDVTEILGSANVETVAELVGAMIDSDTGKGLETVNKLALLGKSMGVLTKDVTEILRDVLIIKTCESAEKILTLPQNRFNVLKGIADRTNEEKILRAMEIFAQAEMDLKYSVNQRVLFETALIKASKPQSDYSIEGLLSRIKTLEDKIESGNIKVVAENTAVKPEPEEQKPTGGKISVLDADETKLKASLLMNLRKSVSEMLWNVMQSVKLVKEKDVLSFYPENNGDYDILIKQENIEKLKLALSDYEGFSINIEEPKKEKQLSEIDQATEKIKKLFGDDIVIVKH